MNPAVAVSELRKSFVVRGQGRAKETLVAVDGVSLSVPEGGSLGIVGESGSGKTTVARIIAGLETPTSGDVVICGETRPRRAGRSAQKRFARYVQMVFQDPYLSLDPRQTVSRSIEEVLRVHFDWNREKRRSRVRELLDHVGLDARQASARPDALSGGQRQRVAIARALAVEPRILILDEAVSALDVSVQAQVLNQLSDVRASVDVAFLVISHDLAVVRQVAEDCVVMHRGRIVEHAPIGQVLDDPQDPYTRQLIDAVPRPGWRPRRSVADAGDRPRAVPGGRSPEYEDGEDDDQPEEPLSYQGAKGSA